MLRVIVGSFLLFVSPFAQPYLGISQVAHGAEEQCPICDGTHRIPCPKCHGEGRYCKTCENKGKIACSRCKGKGTIQCPVCKGKCTIQCPKCLGKGKYWVPRHYVWGTGKKGIKGGLRKVVKAHWERCEKCKGKGKLTCPRCHGKGNLTCPKCNRKGWITCPDCKNKKANRPVCPACEGRGWIPCPACGLSVEEILGKHPEKPPEPALGELHWAMRLLSRETPVMRLLGLCRISSLKTPFTIVVYRAALKEDNRWVQGMALEELLARNVENIATLGGRELVSTLLDLEKGNKGDITELAETLLSRISKRYAKALNRRGADGVWKFQPFRFPEGYDLPSLPSEASKSETTRKEEKRQGHTFVAKKYEFSEELRKLRFGAEELIHKGFDIVWVVDCSGSLKHDFEAMRHLVIYTTKIMDGLFNNTKTGLIAYRDRVESRVKLTGELDNFLKTVHNLTAEKGGGYEEGVDVAISAALNRRAMGWRPQEHVAIVAMGDAGPAGGRRERLYRFLKKAKTARPPFCLHTVMVGIAKHTIGGREFWRKTAEAGGGSTFRLEPKGRPVEGLCASLCPQIDKKIMTRIVSLIMRVEGWSLPFQLRGRNRF